jgi:hypothetical protein
VAPPLVALILFSSLEPSVPVRVLLTRSACALLVLAGVALAAAGGVSLGGPGLVSVLLVAMVVACVAAGIARDGDSPDPQQAAVDAAWRGAVATVTVLLVFSGSVVLAGGAVTGSLAGCLLGALVVRRALRSARTRRGPAATVGPLPGPGALPVRDLSVEALGREWLRTSAALAQVTDLAARQALVDRRRAALDELERRDPAGFARWLAGATVDSDPADYVSGDPAAGYDAA